MPDWQISKWPRFSNETTQILSKSCFFSQRVRAGTKADRRAVRNDFSAPGPLFIFTLNSKSNNGRARRNYRHLIQMCENKSAPGWSVSSTIMEISNGCATRKVICATIKAVNYCCARQRFHVRCELREFSRWPVTIHGQTASTQVKNTKSNLLGRSLFITSVSRPLLYFCLTNRCLCFFPFRLCALLQK